MTVLKSKPGSYYLLYKPYGVLSQFTDVAGRNTLKTLAHFPKDVYSVGRLDMDSEGLILLTDDTAINHRFTDPKFEHTRTYLVQVEGIPSRDAIDRLQKGLVIQGKKTKSTEAHILANDPGITPRIPPIRFRKYIPTTWIEITLREGRNRQVRKMMAAVGHPALRLIRIKIGGLSLEGLSPGDSRSLNKKEIEKLRKLVGS